MCALLTGVPGAHAEEPGSAPELQVNQRLLDERIDQLAQVGDGGAKAAPNAPVTGGSFPRSFIIPGTDTSIRIGGEVRLSVDYITQGGGNNINAVPTNTLGVAGLLESTPLNNDAVSLLLICPEASESTSPATTISGVSALAVVHPG